MFATATKNAGYHPFPRPVANASRAYTNPDGAKFGACQYCGFCQRFGCEANVKGSPHVAVIPLAIRNPNFELPANSWVTKLLRDSDRKTIPGRATSPGGGWATPGSQAAHPNGARPGGPPPPNTIRPP